MSHKVDQQLWLRTVADMVNEDFIKPAGYTIKAIPPIKTGGIPGVTMPLRAAAITAYTDPGDAIDYIEIAGDYPWSPMTGDLATAVLAHEMIHVAISPTYEPRDDHTRPEFVALHDAMGLAGDYHASKPGPAFRKWVETRVIPEYRRREADAS